MSRALLLALVLSVALSNLATSAEPQADRSPSLLRTALLVADADRSQQFYERLGFRAESGFDNPRDPSLNPFPLASPSTRVRLVIMASANGAGGRIGLVEFSSPTPPEGRREPARTAIGDAVMVFDVANAEAIHQMLRAHGANVIEPPQIYVSRQRAADGSPMRGKVFHVRDPDGYLIEILEPPTPVR